GQLPGRLAGLGEWVDGDDAPHPEVEREEAVRIDVGLALHPVRAATDRGSRPSAGRSRPTGPTCPARRPTGCRCCEPGPTADRRWAAGWPTAPPAGPRRGWPTPGPGRSGPGPPAGPSWRGWRWAVAPTTHRPAGRAATRRRCRAATPAGPARAA